MSRELSLKVRDWLRSVFPQGEGITTVTVTFLGKRPEVYRGASFFHNEPRILLVGDAPRSFRKKVRVGGFWEAKFCYRTAGDEGDWYVTSHFVPTEKNAAYHKFHPFGANFILGRWPHEKIGPIDKYCLRERAVFTIEEVG